MVLELQIEVSAKNLLIPQRRLARLIPAPVQQMLRHLSAQAGAQADDTLGVISQCFHIYSRLVMLTLQMADGDKLHQVSVAGFILREQDQVIDRLILAAAPLTA
ncbi:hypothetical protein D3C75_438990 [compost metagenome]